MQLRLCWMIATEGRVVVIYLGFLQPKKSWEWDIFGHRYSKIVSMQSRSVTLARYLHTICAHILPYYILLSPLVPSRSGGLTSWIAAQLRLGGIIVVGISPLLQGRNGYLLSIGWKDRVHASNARKTKPKERKGSRKEIYGNLAHKVRLQNPTYTC